MGATLDHGVLSGEAIGVPPRPPAAIIVPTVSMGSKEGPIILVSFFLKILQSYDEVGNGITDFIVQ